MSSRIFPSWDEMERYHHPLSQTERNLLRILDTQLEKDDRWREGIDKITDYNGWLIFSRPRLNLIEPVAIIYHPRKGFVVYDIFSENLHSYDFNVSVQNLNDGPELSREYNITEENEKSAKAIDKKSYKVTYNFIKDDEIKGRPDAFLKYCLESMKGHIVPELGKYISENSLRTVQEEEDGEVKTKTLHLKSPVQGVLIFERNDSFDITAKLRKPFYFRKEENGETTYLKSSKESPSAMLVGKDEVLRGELASVVPAFLIDGSDKVTPWCTGLNLEIINWLKPPVHRIQNCVEIVLTPEQMAIANPSPGHHRVVGVAGSGKTIALAYRAAKLASMGCKVLIVSYNITMWHYIKETIDGKTPFEFSWGNLTFCHFHGLCNSMLKKFNFPWPSDKNIDKDALFSRIVVDTVRARIPEDGYPKFDAILIDEGQDFDEEWYKLLKDKFLNEHDEMVIVSDRRQNLYDKSSDWFYDKKYFHIPIVNLTNSFRLPAGIAAMATSFAYEFGLNSDLEISGDAGFESGAQIRWLNHDYCGAQRFHVSKSEWDDMSDEERKQYDEDIVKEEASMDEVAAMCLRAYEHFNRRCGTPSDIAILVISHEWGHHLVNYFENNGVESNNIFTSETKKNNFFLDKQHVKICTIHSFKGWELQNVILVIPHMVSEQLLPAVKDGNGGYLPYSRIDTAIYTAITRVQRNLIVINENGRYRAFGRHYPSSL